MFTKNFPDFNPIFGFCIGVIMTQSELTEFGETAKFKKLFVFKRFYEGCAHYFSSKFLKGGPTSGFKPQPIEKPIRSEFLPPLDKTKELEEALVTFAFNQTNGSLEIHRFNDKKIIEILSPLLVDNEIMEALTKGDACSTECKGEDVEIPDYNLLDESRFKLDCGHYSIHLQCFASNLSFGGFSYPFCVIGD